MKIEFTGRNFTLSPAIKKQVTGHFKKIETVLNGAVKAHVILSIEKHHRHLAEIVVNWHDRALTQTPTRAICTLRSLRQSTGCESRRSKSKERLSTANITRLATSAVAPSPIPPVAPAAPAPRIIRSRRYSVKPMTPEEAVLRVSEAPEQFLVFRDAETDRVGVIYKRRDGNLA